MDGLLVDTEPMWREAEKEVFKEVGISLTEQMTISTTGKKITEVVEHWYSYYPWDENKFPKSKVSDDVVKTLMKLIAEKGQKMDGADHMLNFFENTNLKMALASSSPMVLIKFILKKFKLENDFFVVHSGEDEKLGKPDPAVYISTAKKLGVSPEECLAFEDSYYGLLSAKRAGIKTVIVPNKTEWNDKRFDIADIKLKSLSEFDEEHFKLLNN
jgi:mannitol-1-/sugar-/sorbitol-6-/2-deoxyglucose-6-phosphatase